MINLALSTRKWDLTSPLEPLNKHFESQPRLPSRRVKLNDHTDPPESEHKASACRPVHFTFNTPLFGVIASGSTRIVSPDAVSIITICPRAKPANSRVFSSLNARLETAPCCKCSWQHHLSVCKMSNAKIWPRDVPTAIISLTATDVAVPAFIRSYCESIESFKIDLFIPILMVCYYRSRGHLCGDALQNDVTKHCTALGTIIYRRCWREPVSYV